MRADVSFIPLGFRGNLNVSGNGYVYLTETGLVIEGIFSRFYFPLAASVFRQFVGVWSLRTVPYLTIESHKLIRLKSYLQVRFRLPGGKQLTVSFKGKGKHAKQQLKELDGKLTEHRATLQAMTGGK